MKSLFSLLFIFLLPIYVFSQFDFTSSFKSGAEDAERYLKAYFNPAVISFGSGLAGGWTNTAKAHKPLGFDLTLSVNLARVPERNLTFSFGDNSTWKNLQSVNPNPDLPTIMGGSTDEKLTLNLGETKIRDPFTGQEIVLSDQVKFEEFDAVDGLNVRRLLGIGISAIPTPTLTLGIGIYKNTDLKVRFIPTVGSKDVKFNLFGVGILHDFKQWIPGIKTLPFDMSAFVGTTVMNTKVFYNLSQSANFTNVGDLYTHFQVITTSVQFLVSKKLSVFTPYASIGYNFVNTSYKTKGTLKYTQDFTGGTSVEITDPTNIKFKGGSSPRFTVGGRLKFAILTLYADYTFQKYSMLTVGFGFSIREQEAIEL